MKTNRRRFLGSAGISGAGFLLGSRLTESATQLRSESPDFDLIKEVRKYRKIDAHAHVGFEPGDEDRQIEFAERLGIEKLCISRPITNFSGNEPEGPEQVRENNDIIINAVRRHPDRFIGFLTLNPVYQRESLDEISRCVDQGMAGYKGYTQVKINNPLYYPIIEKFIDLKMIVLMHGFCQLGLAGYRMKYDIGKAPNTSIPEDFVDAARRYPEAMFQFAHIGGGGDWEYECKAFRDVPNIFVDTSGSNNEEHMIDFALKYLGEERIFFGTDNSFYQGVGKILAADLSESQKNKIFFENYNNILKESGNHVA